MPISPQAYVERVRDRRTLLVYARYDTTFPVHLSLELMREFRGCEVPHQLSVLPCGHYTHGPRAVQVHGRLRADEVPVKNL